MLDAWCFQALDLLKYLCLYSNLITKTCTSGSIICTNHPRKPFINFGYEKLQFWWKAKTITRKFTKFWLSLECAVDFKWSISCWVVELFIRWNQNSSIQRPTLHKTTLLHLCSVFTNLYKCACVVVLGAFLKKCLTLCWIWVLQVVESAKALLIVFVLLALHSVLEPMMAATQYSCAHLYQLYTNLWRIESAFFLL